MLLMAYVDLNKTSREDTWFLDSGCSNHMCGKKDYFSDFDGTFRDSVKLGNNTSMSVLGKGNVRLKVNEMTQIITRVFYVPELKNNLLSIGQLQEKGLTILFQHGKCKVFHSQKGLIMDTKMSSNRMFMLHALSQPILSTCFNTVTEDILQLWHCRYGHLSFQGLKTLQQRKMVNGLPQFQPPSKLCKDCLVGKQHRSSIPKKNNWRSVEILQLVHANICGPINPISNSKKRYLLTFIDDFSRKTWVYFLVEKSEALAVFKSFKIHVEKKTNSFLRSLRTDRGGEFTSQEFANFCDVHGIRRQLTAAYTPQQNGVAEHKNRTIMNMVRSMLSRKKLPKNFWPEAVNWAMHVLNRSPTFAIQNKTLEEAWGKLKPSVDYFRVFRCISHVHVPDSKRTKLDDKSFSCVSLGVTEESKAYKLYDPISQKIIISRDVVFEEDKNWDWDKKYEEAIVCDLEWGDDGEEATVNEEESDSNFDADIEEDTEENNASDVVAESNVAVTTSDLLIQNRDNPSNSNAARNRRPPIWMSDYETGEELSEEEHEVQLAMFTAADPIYFDEAVKSEKWRTAMDVEMEAIKKNGTWELKILPKGGKTIGVKWVYKTKFNENGEVEKHKARLVVKGYTQQFRVDYTELDVKSAFLHGELNEEIFIEQPCGYVQKGNEQKVYKLNKALYGLKQAPCAWYSRIEAYFMKEVFEKCDYEHTLFIKTNKEGKVLIVSLYVDDLIFTGNDELMFAEFKHSMKHEFDMTDLGKMRYFLGLEVLQKSDGIFISQKRYVLEVLNRFGMDKSNSISKPIVPGCKLVKDEGKGGDDELVAYTDSDYAGNLEDRKSTSEFIAATSCACQAVWLKRVLGKLDQNQSKSCVIQCDSSSAIKLSKNPVMHGRNKHIDVRFHFLRDLTKDGSMELVYCDTQEQLVDIMTKPLKLNTFVKLRGQLGVCSETYVN
ncbi:Retrovirus-related Pol polyprotein from transposon TNT 1-94 [Vitis vinifera]|uniref:Retrovirus-related Pol polyprotein from transposon TNT 1-94 n=1 Tax=Vitis vinifera TaxID=29760 RepID=A0A438DUG0_VITVI|nr:Retrovirus-related Pol polyprotein from transposon TNT 1-94 [Vitis vinifera]